MKKVAYLMEYPIDLPGGAQLSTAGICEALSQDKDLGYEPVVVCPELLDRDRDLPFRVREYPMIDAEGKAGNPKVNRIRNFILRVKAFHQIISEEKPDLIHIEMAESLISYLFVLPFFPGIPYIYTDRGMYFGYRKRSLFFMLPALKNAAMMVTTTKRNKELWKKNSKIRPIVVIPNTISDAFHYFDPERKKKGGRLSIGFAGRICVEKDWPLVPEIIKVLEGRGLDFEVRLVLSLFEKGDREIADRLKQDITGIIGEERLFYFEDLTQAEMSDFYYSVDLFLMTSVFESFGKAAVEAMSRKCAVLATRVGGLPEVIGREENLYDKEDLEKVADFAGRMEDSEVLQKEQEYFYRRYLENYTADAYVKKHLKVYGYALKAGGTF